MARPRPATIVLATSALALVVGTVGIATAGSGSSVSSEGSRPQVSDNRSPEVPQGSRPTTQDSPAGQTKAAPSSPFRTLERTSATRLPRPDRTPRPTAIMLPGTDVRAPVDVVGVDDAGQVEVPTDVTRAGWYRFSVAPGGTRGSTVIVGHRDGVNQGTGAFAALDDLRPGDSIEIERADGVLIGYTVVARESFDKSRVPFRELFSKSGPARLTLITCGGPFDSSTLGYTDNIVITALPVDTASGSGETQ